MMKKSESTLNILMIAIMLAAAGVLYFAAEADQNQADSKAPAAEKSSTHLACKAPECGNPKTINPV